MSEKSDSVLSHFSIVGGIVKHVIDNYSSESEPEPVKEPTPEPTKEVTIVSESSFYEGVSSGFAALIDEEVDRLKELSMEVLPLDQIAASSQQISSKDHTRSTFKIRHRKLNGKKKLTKL